MNQNAQFILKHRGQSKNLTILDIPRLVLIKGLVGVYIFAHSYKLDRLVAGKIHPGYSWVVQVKIFRGMYLFALLSFQKLHLYCWVFIAQTRRRMSQIFTGY